MNNNNVKLELLLDKDIEYYNDVLSKKGIENIINLETHDLYFCNVPFKTLEKMKEGEIKEKCVRFRMFNCFGGSCFSGDFEMHMEFQNFKIFDNLKEDNFKCFNMDQFKKIQDELENNGWHMIIDMFKVDYKYKINDMQNYLHFQEIDNIGLVLSYSNQDYSKMNEDNQREMLIKELNDYGFDFDKDVLCIDKLKTLLTGKSQFSKIQNV